MRTVTVNYNIYKYNELSDEAKEKAKQDYLDDPIRTMLFSESCDEDLKLLFGVHSNLAVQYSLCSCQGDGLNIYGDVYAEDILECLEKHNGGTRFEGFENYLTEKEKRTILCYAKQCDSIKLEYNRRYNYSLAEYIDIGNEWVYQLENCSYFRNINTEVISKFETMVREMFSKLCSNYEKDGYKYFYEIDDEEIQYNCEANEYEFYENGELYIG